MNLLRIVLFAVAALGLVAGIAAPWTGFAAYQSTAWALAGGIVLAALLYDIVTSLARKEVGLDIVAGLSMSVALLFGEYLAAAVVGLMYAGGQLLEDFAAKRAQSHMRALLARVPKTAMRYDDGALRDVPIDDVRTGDRLLIRQGDIIPVDGKVISGRALLDLSALTGESVPQPRAEGDDVQSGARSMDGAFDMMAARPASESAYAAIVRMVKAAQEAKAPMVRLADRYALWFLAVTAILAGAAWAFSGDHIRMLAVLVVATPCPLILAVPVAIISGMGKAARHGVLMKGGPVLETMARAEGLVIDKTGTLTHGKAELIAILPQSGWDAGEVLRLAASLEQSSAHVIAASVVTAGRQRQLPLTFPEDVHETAGEGLAGQVKGAHVVVGGPGFVRRQLKLQSMERPQTEAGTVQVAVGVDGRLAGFLVLADAVRAETPRALARLREAGIKRIVLASGDTQAIVDRIGGDLGLDVLRGDLAPEDKVQIVLDERGNGVTLMAGDGVNDAPALAAADVGISMGARGSAAASETADAVLLVDDLERLAVGVETAKRARTIALQSVFAGLGLSLAGMVVAAFGYLQPVQGAIVQEVIDVAVILNALRALR
ncbi:MAG TPA: heavy metal translocating P-type ATPase [Aestuariivirga sp.]|nr:heavy metal translocating P-type ATPase [Aestuariivirga sp.]